MDLAVEYPKPAVLECLSSAIEEGYDSPEKLAFANLNRSILSRVEVHQKFYSMFPVGLDTPNDVDYSSVYSQVAAQIS